MKRLSLLSCAFVERIKVNQVWCDVRDERRFWFKRRRRTALPVLAGANLFFRLANARVRTLPDSNYWQSWEVNSFQGLHGDEGFRAFRDGKHTIGVEELPGINVTIPLDNGTLTPRIAEAVGRELCRAHQWHCPEIGARWSHGDPHAGNFIYDAASDRARIIDFEVMHHPEIPEAERHADDVLIFLQDIVGRIQADQWVPCAEAFLYGYHRAEIIKRALSQLQIPHPMAARLWWRVRTSFLALPELEQRLQALLQAVKKQGDQQPGERLLTAGTLSGR